MLGESAYPDWLTAEQSTGVSNLTLYVKSSKYWLFLNKSKDISVLQNAESFSAVSIRIKILRK